MALIPAEPLREMGRFRKDFDNFFSGFPSMFSNDNMGVRVDVHETDEEVIATCDIPGIEKKEDINIVVNHNVLSINGTIQHSNEIKKEHMHRKERYSGTFQRTIGLPSPVLDEDVNASYKNGVLEVKMPKLTKDEKKQIDVNFE